MKSEQHESHRINFLNANIYICINCWYARERLDERTEVGDRASKKRKDKVKAMQHVQKALDPTPFM